MIDIIEKCSILELCKIWKQAFSFNNYERILKENTILDHREIEQSKDDIVKYVNSFEKKKVSSGYKLSK